eukprot:TRINITY_DN9947_c0_g1_i1.p2 TRINITY_DN9947_c0_g1~~TRINITY_DN9947_c0_g1_i1.p2  ORF type:complete len:164 (+),score=39.54 TRINITY_DN9947_c0_g1_i1:48-539(+)
MADNEEQETGEGEESNCPFLLRVTDQNFEELFNNEEKLVCSIIISNNCEFCQKLMPFFNELASKQTEYANTQFLLIDADQVDSEIVKKYSVSSVPHFAFTLKGEPLESFSGNNTEKLVGMLTNNLQKRNETMKEYDAQKKATEAAAAAAAEEQQNADGEGEGE